MPSLRLEASVRRRPVRRIRAAVAFAAALLACTPESPRFERVILIVVDTLRRDSVWPYDPRADTPNVRRLAERGQVFTNALASFHQTTMSMASLFTGRTPSLETGSRTEPLPWNGRNWCGLSRLAASDKDTCVPQRLDTLAEDMRAAGYRTIGVASNAYLYRPSGYDQGFDDWVQLGPERGDERQRDPVGQKPLARRGERVTRTAIEALGRRPHDRFFLYVHYMDVHDWRWLLGRDYAGAVAVMDAAFGELLDHLEAEGLLENALVVFTSDHGEMRKSDETIKRGWFHVGNPSFEPVLQVPLIVAPPTSNDSASYVRTQDLRGLLMSWIGHPAPQDPQGLRGFVMRWIGRPASQDLAFDEQLLTEAEWQTYRRWPWKSVWKRNEDVVHLFDLRGASPERRDVSKEHPEVLQSHRERIDALAAKLSTSRGRNTELTEEDLRRLRALGYAE
jgi:arylsulfatase A-like enzyme